MTLGAPDHQTEVWFRNPDLYAREFIEVGASRIVWDEDLLNAKRIDPTRWAEVTFPTTYQWRMVVIGEKFAREYRAGAKPATKPLAVYPVWRYGDDIEFLEMYLNTPWGEDDDLCFDKSVPEFDRPVYGQEHRVIVAGLPILSTGPGKRFILQLGRLQEEFRGATMHVNGMSRYRSMFGLGFNSVDIDPRYAARSKKAQLPNGAEMTADRTTSAAQWVTVLGFSPVDLADPKKLIQYNMKSALWAGLHYMENFKFRVAGGPPPDPTASGGSPPTTVAVHSGKVQEGDKFYCDTCSLQNTCKYQRAGAVCSIPESEPASLAAMFGTRDPDRIIEGLGGVLSLQAKRMEAGHRDEEELGELDPEVTRIAHAVFVDGTRLVKLLNPALAGGPRTAVYVNAGNGAQVGVGSSPKAIVAGIFGELEAQGVPREKITAEMVKGVLAAQAGEVDPDARRNAITAQAQEVAS